MVISIKFASDPDGAIKGAKDVATALEDVADSLDDVAAEAQRAGAETGDALGDGARDGAQKASAATADLSGDLREVAGDADRAGNALDTGLGDGARDAARTADKALDDITDSLRDVDRAADRAGDALGDDITDGAKAATTSTERLEKSFKELSDAARKHSDKAGKDLQRGITDGADGASEAVAEWGDEAVSNLSETVSSFRGDAEDLVQVVQDTFGGVVANLGPVGMAAGVAGAAGIGLLMGAFERAQEAEQAFREQVAELADILIDTGGEGADHIEAIAARMRDLAAPTDDAVKSLSEIAAQAEAAGIPVDELARAYAGAGGDLKKYITLMEEEYDKTVGLDQVATRAAQAKREGYKDAKDALTELAEEQEAAAEAARILEEAGYSADMARAESMRTLQGELDNAIGSWKDYSDAETGATDPGAYIAAMQARMDATTNFNTNVQELATRFGLTHDEVQAILDQGVDFAPMLQSIMDSGMGDEYAAQIRAMLDGGQSIVDGTPTTVHVEADTDAADSALSQATEGRTSTITADSDTDAAETALGATADAERTATIGTKGDVRAADAALNRTARQRRTAIITARANTGPASAALSRLARSRTATVHVRLDLTTAQRQMNEFVSRYRETVVHTVTRTGKANR
ncbi:MAG: hypothetical protein ACK5O2_00840 [Microthrixaceae bacterium]